MIHSQSGFDSNPWAYLGKSIDIIHLRDGVNYIVPQTISFEASERLQIKIRGRESLIDWLIAQGID